MKALHMTAFVLLVIGGLNWFLVGVGLGDVVAYLPSWLATIVYVLVGLSAVYIAVTHKKCCNDCGCTPSAPQM